MCPAAAEDAPLVLHGSQSTAGWIEEGRPPTGKHQPHAVQRAQAQTAVSVSGVRLWPVVAGKQTKCGTLAGTRGATEHITHLFAGPGADTAAAAFMARALAIAPRWWRITATAYPIWR